MPIPALQKALHFAIPTSKPSSTPGGRFPLKHAPKSAGKSSI